MKILVFDIFEKGQILRPFRPSTLKTEICSKKFNGSTCAYSLFYLPIFRKIEGGVDCGIPSPLRSLRYRKKRGPERVN